MGLESKVVEEVQRDNEPVIDREKVSSKKFFLNQFTIFYFGFIII